MFDLDGECKFIKTKNIIVIIVIKKYVLLSCHVVGWIGGDFVYRKVAADILNLILGYRSRQQRCGLSLSVLQQLAVYVAGLKITTGLCWKSLSACDMKCRKCFTIRYSKTTYRWRTFWKLGERLNSCTNNRMYTRVFFSADCAEIGTSCKKVVKLNYFFQLNDSTFGN